MKNKTSNPVITPTELFHQIFHLIVILTFNDCIFPKITMVSHDCRLLPVSHATGSQNLFRSLFMSHGFAGCTRTTALASLLKNIVTFADKSSEVHFQFRLRIHRFPSRYYTMELYARAVLFQRGPQPPGVQQSLGHCPASTQGAESAPDKPAFTRCSLKGAVTQRSP